jgi:glycosyltransferase involved in cell wall biosynthesis
MKILHVIETISPNYGGPVSVLKDLAAGESFFAAKVEIVTTNGDCPSGIYCPAGVMRHWCGSDVDVHIHKVDLSPIGYSSAFRRWINCNLPGFDLLYVHGLYRFPQTYASHVARTSGIPYIIRPQGALDPYLYKQSSKSVILKRIYERLFDLPNLRGASAIHYMTEDERVRARYLNVKSPSFVIPNGLNWDRYVNLPARGSFRDDLAIGGRPLVLFLGRINFKKGLDILIPAFAKVREVVPDAVLAIVGPDNEGYGVKVLEWVRQRGLETCVRFVGPLSEKSVIQSFVDSDLFVLPSYTENFGMAVVEALACGAPVVISDQVNIHGEVAAAGVGLVTRCDAGEVAEALCTLLADPARRIAMGAAGRALVQRKWTWDVVASQLMAEYEKVIARHRDARSTRGE